MMTIPRGVNSNDVHQWLNGGWFAILRDRGPIVAKYDMVDDGQVYYVDEDGNRQVCNRSDVSIHWPACGAVNMDGYVVNLERSARQQYRRTYNSRVLSAKVPEKWRIIKTKGTTFPSSPNDPAVVRAAFFPTYYTYMQALDKLDNGWVTVALSPSIVLAGSGEKQMLYYRGDYVGNIENFQIAPLAEGGEKLLRRLLKFFDGRVTLC